LEELLDFAVALKVKFPNRLVIEAIGATISGRAMQCLQIFPAGRKDDDNLPVIIIELGNKIIIIKIRVKAQSN